MNQARVKAFVKTWNQFRKDMTREVEWANGCGVPFSLPEVQESDFPGCMKQLRSVLNHSLFTYWKTRLCFESRVRNRAKKMLERLEAVMVEEGPAWTEVTSHKVWCVDTSDKQSWFRVTLEVVFEDGAAGKQEFYYNIAKGEWGHSADGQNKESARVFFVSDLARSCVAEALATRKSMKRDEAKAAIRQAATEAMNKGLDNDEIKTLVDEVLAESVMAA